MTKGVRLAITSGRSSKGTAMLGLGHQQRCAGGASDSCRNSSPRWARMVRTILARIPCRFSRTTTDDPSDLSRLKHSGRALATEPTVGSCQASLESEALSRKWSRGRTRTGVQNGHLIYRRGAAGGQKSDASVVNATGRFVELTRTSIALLQEHLDYCRTAAF